MIVAVLALLCAVLAAALVAAAGRVAQQASRHSHDMRDLLAEHRDGMRDLIADAGEERERAAVRHRTDIDAMLRLVVARSPQEWAVLNTRSARDNVLLEHGPATRPERDYAARDELVAHLQALGDDDHAAHLVMEGT